MNETHRDSADTDVPTHFSDTSSHHAPPDANSPSTANPSTNSPSTANPSTITPSTDNPAIVATDLALSSEDGPVYGPLTFTVPNQGVTILYGRGGSGRTALALTLSGRMKPSEGSLEVLGATKLLEIRDRVAIAGVAQVDGLERDVTVGTLLTEHLNWSRSWWQPRRNADEEYLESIAADVFGPRELPELDAYVSSLSGLERHLLRMALALQPAHGKPIEMLIVDDLEQIHELDNQHFLLERISAISEEIPVVVNAANPIPEGLIPVAATVLLSAKNAPKWPKHHLLTARGKHHTPDPQTARGKHHTPDPQSASSAKDDAQ